MRGAQRMGTAVALQAVAAVVWVIGGFLLARWGGLLMAATIPLFLLGWTLERRHGGS